MSHIYASGKLGTPAEIKEFSQKYLVTEALVKENVRHLADLKLKADKRQEEAKLKKKPRGKKQAAKSQQEFQQEEVNDDDEISNDEEDDDHDAIINTIDGEEEDEDGDPDKVVFVPRLKTVTRHGRIAGTWQRSFQQSHDSSDTSSDSDLDTDTPDTGETPQTNPPKPGRAPQNDRDKLTVVTRSGRRATSWKAKK